MISSSTSRPVVHSRCPRTQQRTPVSWASRRYQAYCNWSRNVGLAPSKSSNGLRTAACELVLEALVHEKRISRLEGGGYRRMPHEGPSGPKFPGLEGPLEGFEPI